MNVREPSKQWGFRLGQYLYLVFIFGAVYGLYGAAYWLMTDRLYFGPWEWGLCFITFSLYSLVSRGMQAQADRVDQKLRMRG